MSNRDVLPDTWDPVSDELTRVRIARLQEYCAQLLCRYGLPPADATGAAAAYIETEARGVASHGLRLLVRDLWKLRAGVIATSPTSTVVDHGPVGVLDGGNGLGPVVATRGMALAIEKARHFGVGAVGVRNGNHFGAAGYYAALAAAQGMIGLATSNAAAIMAPPGGLTPVVGNNPIAIAIPTGQEPILFDVALSVVSYGRLRLAAQQGISIPPGWARSAEGLPTTSSRAALTGLLEPFGAHKGFGLAVAVEALTSALTGAACSWEIANAQRADRPERRGHFFLALDLEQFVSRERFAQRLHELSRRVAQSSSDHGVARLPGARAGEQSRLAAQQGIPLPRGLVAQIEELAGHVNLPPLCPV